MTRARFVVLGVVQGVNFRAAAAREATALGLTGRVWNTNDDGVELIAEGPAASLANFERWLARGASNARSVRAIGATTTSGSRTRRRNDAERRAVRRTTLS